MSKLEFDWENFLKTEFPNGRMIKTKSDKIEYLIDCISPDCPNPKNHMFVNITSRSKKHDKKFICHRCGLSGNHKAFLTFYFKMPYDLIVKNIVDLYGFDDDYYSLINDSINEIKKSDIKIRSNYKNKEGFILDLPKYLRPINKNHVFLKRRNFDYNFVKKFDISVCYKGFYKNRIIFPITTNENKSFLAYSHLTKRSLKKWKKLSKINPKNKTYRKKSRKILYPLKSLTSMLLYNYDNIPKNADFVFMVEGVLDCMRLLNYGYYAVAYLGGRISEYQAILMDKKSPKEICFMPDSDVDGKKFNSSLGLLLDNVDSIISYIRLTKGDPNETKKKEVKHLIKNRLFINSVIASEKILTIR